MRVAIVGGGQSNKYFDPKGYNLVFGCNDAHTYVKGVNVICVTDTKAKILNDRPKTLKTPQHVQMYFRQRAGWESFALQRRNAQQLETRRYNHRVDKNRELPKHIFLHGFHTPFFCISVALNKYNAKEVDLYGIDCGNFKPSQFETIANEFEYFASFVKLGIEKHCEIWKLNENRNLLKSVSLFRTDPAGKSSLPCGKST